MISEIHSDYKLMIPIHQWTNFNETWHKAGNKQVLLKGETIAKIVKLHYLPYFLEPWRLFQLN